MCKLIIIFTLLVANQRENKRIQAQIYLHRKIAVSMQ